MDLTVKDYYLNLWQKDLSRLNFRTPRTPVGLEGKVSFVRCAEDIYKACLMYEAFGLNRDTTRSLSAEYIIEVNTNDPNLNYVGVIDNRFGVYTSQEVVSDSRHYTVLTIPDSNYVKNFGLGYDSLDYVENDNRLLTDTPELAMLLGRVLREIGKTWADGSEYTDTDMQYNKDGGTVYNLRSGSQYSYNDSVTGEEERFSYRLCGNNVHLTVYENTFMPESLELGKVYSIVRGCRFSRDIIRKLFKVSHESIKAVKCGENTSRFQVLDNSSYSQRQFYADSSVLDDVTKEDLDYWAAAEERELKEAEEQRLEELRREIRRRRVFRENILEQGYLRRNQHVESQLLSSSLHSFLFKVWDKNIIAKKLLKLNKVSYTEGSLRNITITRSTQEMTYTLPNKDTVMATPYTWEKKGRQSGKYGKILRKVLKENLPNFKIVDKDLEVLVNHLKACADNGDFKLVDGEDILYWYDGSNYADDDDTGTLGHSCMRHNTEYMELYARNPDVCKMVVLVKDDMLYGRALIWLDKYMDRIYGSDSTITAFKAYAKKKGYHYKSAQNSECYQDWVNPDTDEVYTEYLTISLNTNVEYYPYADTFFYINTENGTISNSEDTDEQLRETDGSLTGGQRVYDEVDGVYIDEDYAVWLEYEGYYTHSDNTGYCDISNDYYLLDEMVTLTNGDYVHQEAEGVLYVEEDGCYAHQEDTFTCEYDDILYTTESHEPYYLEELGITVHEDRIKDAYVDEGFTYNEDTEEWELITEKQEA